MKHARHALGLSLSEFVALVGIAANHADRKLRRWEDGEEDIPGPVAVIVRACMESAAVREYFKLNEPRRD